MTWSSFPDVREGRRSGALGGHDPDALAHRVFLPVMNGPRVQLHRREGKRRSPDPGDLRAIYGGHPDRAVRRRATIISAPAGVPPRGARGVPHGRAPATSAGELARSERPGDRLAAGHPGSARLTGEAQAGLACWHQRVLSEHSRSSARNPVAARDWSRARRSPASGRVSGRGGRNGSAAESYAQNLWVGALAVAR